MNEPQLAQRPVGLHRLFMVGIALSLLFYVVSLFLPAVAFGKPGGGNGWSGGALLFYGIVSLNQTPAWLENIAYFFGLVFCGPEMLSRQAPTQRWKRLLRFVALALFVAAILLGLTTLRHLEVPFAIGFNSGEGVVRRVMRLRPGFYCWIGSFAVAGFTMIIAFFERVSPQRQLAETQEGEVIEQY